MDDLGLNPERLECGHFLFQRKIQYLIGADQYLYGSHNEHGHWTGYRNGTAGMPCIHRTMCSLCTSSCRAAITVFGQLGAGSLQSQIRRRPANCALCLLASSSQMPMLTVERALLGLSAEYQPCPGCAFLPYLNLLSHASFSRGFSHHHKAMALMDFICRPVLSALLPMLQRK